MLEPSSQDQGIPDDTFRWPALSVVVPALNEEATIAACLDSLAAQTYQGRVEIIVVDNGSEDATADIARAHGAIVVDAPQRGVCAARQRGTEAATGDIVVSTDADTTHSPDWLDRIAAAFRSDDVVAVCGPCRFVDGPRWATVYTKALFGLVWLCSVLTGRVLYATATNIGFRRSAFAGYDLRLTQGGDELGLLRSLRRQGRIVFARGNDTWTSSRRLHRGFVYSVLVTCLWYYLIAYTVNRLAGRTVLGNAPVIREDERGSVRTRRLARLRTASAGLLVVLLVHTFVRFDLDFA